MFICLLTEKILSNCSFQCNEGAATAISQLLDMMKVADFGITTLASNKTGNEAMITNLDVECITNIIDHKRCFSVTAESINMMAGRCHLTSNKYI